MEIKIGDRFIAKNDAGNPIRTEVVVTNIYTPQTSSHTPIEIPERYNGTNMAERAEKYNAEDPPTEVMLEIQGATHMSTPHQIRIDIFEKNYKPYPRPFSDPNEKRSKKLLETAFKTLLAGTYSSGGDGSGTLLVSHYDFRAVADAFGEYEIESGYEMDQDGKVKKDENGNDIHIKRKIKDIYFRNNYADRVLFSDMSNENMTIGPAFLQGKLGPYDDVVIIL